MRVHPYLPRQAARHSATLIAALVASACSDREPTAPARIAPVAAVRRATSYAASYPLGVDGNGVSWTLYPGERVVRTNTGTVLTLSPELTAYFANAAAQEDKIAADDAAIARARSRRPTGCASYALICRTSAQAAPSTGAVSPQMIVPGDDPGGGSGGSAGTSDGVYQPSPGVVLDPSGSGPTEERSIGVDMSYAEPGNTCRDIVAAWGKQQAGYEAARQSYKEARKNLFWGITAKLATYRFAQPAAGGQPAQPGGFPAEPPLPGAEAENLRQFLAEVKDVKTLLATLAVRYGLEGLAAQFDLAATNYMSAMVQRGFYAQMFNAYQCGTRTDWQQSASGTAGGGSTNTLRYRICYYWVTTRNGVVVSERLLYCNR